MPESISTSFALDVTKLHHNATKHVIEADSHLKKV